MIRWTLLSTLATALFYGLYMLLLRRDGWLQLSRAYLIGTLVFSLAFPFVRLPKAVLPTLVSAMSAEPIMLIADGQEVEATTAETGLSLDGILPRVYLIGVVLTLAFLLFQLASKTITLLTLRRQYSVRITNNALPIPRHASLILLPDDTAPYSFFNQIVVGTQHLDNDELHCILAHESLHVRRTHSLDLLFMRTLCCMAWFNPFAWLMMRELRAVHEFQADTASLATCGTNHYLRLLYKQATGIGYGHITNNFQSINIKKRIAMMNKPKTRYGACKLLAALPLAVLMMVLGCQPAADKATDTEEPATVYQTDLADSAQSQVTIAAADDVSTLRAESNPEFVGGMEALSQYIADNIRYPEQAKNDGTQGRVLVRFTVEPDGSVADAEVLRGIGSGCDEEALRVVKSMPKWKPGQVNGRPVRVQYTLPITFKLQ